MKIFFLILHYQALNETLVCVNSILKLYKDVNIVIVDNSSPNNSGNKIKNLFLDCSNIKVIINDENKGFARGNNVGYKYAKEHGADFIIQVNHDTIFEDINFISILQNLYKTERYAVLGPDVICISNNQHQNPLRSIKISKFRIILKILKNALGYFLAFVDLDTVIKKETIFQPKWEEFIDITQSNKYVLQGCCYIFSPLYIKKIEGMFEGSFMYYEEYIQDFICRKNHLKTIYSPKLYLKHLRQVATSSIIKNDKKKRQFKYKNSITSLIAFYKAYLR